MTLCGKTCASTEALPRNPKIRLINVVFLRTLSEIKLKRTDTTLDLSQKAKRAGEEKKKSKWRRAGRSIYTPGREARMALVPSEIAWPTIYPVPRDPHTLESHVALHTGSGLVPRTYFIARSSTTKDFSRPSPGAGYSPLCDHQFFIPPDQIKNPSVTMAPAPTVCV